jgi:hypothetical protein
MIHAYKETSSDRIHFYCDICVDNNIVDIKDCIKLGKHYLGNTNVTCQSCQNKGILLVETATKVDRKVPMSISVKGSLKDLIVQKCQVLGISPNEFLMAMMHENLKKQFPEYNLD